MRSSRGSHLAAAGAGDHRRRLHRALQRARVDAGQRPSAEVARHRFRLRAPAVGEPPSALPAVDDLLRVVDLPVADEVEDGHTGHDLAERGEQHEPLAHRQAQGLGQAAAVELELRRVVRGLGQRLLGGDAVRLVVDDHEPAVLLEHEVDDALDAAPPPSGNHSGSSRQTRARRAGALASRAGRARARPPSRRARGRRRRRGRRRGPAPPPSPRTPLAARVRAASTPGSGGRGEPKSRPPRRPRPPRPPAAPGAAAARVAEIGHERPVAAALRAAPRARASQRAAAASPPSARRQRAQIRRRASVALGRGSVAGVDDHARRRRSARAAAAIRSFQKSPDARVRGRRAG